MYFAYGFPKALITGCQPPDDTDVVYISFNADYMFVVCSASVQVWSGGQHRIKLGELSRSAESLAEEGANVRALWCPSKRVLAVAVSSSPSLLQIVQHHM
jgi:RAB6A-GEF complex partner protein 1